jgi:hypothetical protein
MTEHRFKFENHRSRGVAYVMDYGPDEQYVSISQQFKHDPETGLEDSEIAYVMIPVDAFKAMFAQLSKHMD